MSPRKKPTPGTLEYMYRGSIIIAIHADWPAYPPPDKSLALYDLGQFPEETEFLSIDEIDQCTLFRAACGEVHTDPYDERDFHVAIWNQDLLELSNSGLISGVTTATDVEILRAQRAEMTGQIAQDLAAEGIEVPDGLDLLSTMYIEHNGIKYSVADLWDDRIHAAESTIDEWEACPDRKVYIEPGQAVQLTRQGWSEIAAKLADESSMSAKDRLTQLYNLGFYDTAVREGSVLLESTIRDITGLHSSGISLVEAFIKKLRGDPGWPDWAVRRFHSDLRTIFKFVRNQFAHEIVDISPTRAKVLVDRISLLIDAVCESDDDHQSD